MKLTVDYNANNGFSCVDGRTEEYADHFIAKFLKQNNDQTVTIASEIIIDFFRLRLAEGVIKKDQIKFTFDGETLEHDKLGTMRHWPKGYCDTAIAPVEQLLTIGSKAWKEKRKKSS